MGQKESNTGHTKLGLRGPSLCVSAIRSQEHHFHKLRLLYEASAINVYGANTFNKKRGQRVVSKNGH